MLEEMLKRGFGWQYKCYDGRGDFVTWENEAHTEC
ncbi:unnamed protein product [Musa banksii]